MRHGVQEIPCSNTDTRSRKGEDNGGEKSWNDSGATGESSQSRLEQKEKGSWKEHSIEQKEHDRFVMHLSILTGVL